MPETVIRIADFREHQVRIEAVVGGGAAGSFSSGARGGSGAAGNAVRGSLVGGVSAAPGHEGFVSRSVMIEGHVVLALNHVEIAEGIFGRGDAPAVV